MRQIFLGKPLHWLLWIFVIGVLGVLGQYQMHVRYFNGFIFTVLALAVIVVGVILASYSEGDRITREPFEET